MKRALVVVLALTATASAVPPARGFAGGIPTVDVLEGTASAEVLSVRVDVDGERFSAREEIQLGVPHDTVELVLLDRTELPVDTYVASAWRWDAVQVALDGEPVEPEFRLVSRTAEGGWKRAEGATEVGGWVVEVGRNVRTVEYRWRGPVVTRETMAYAGFLLPVDFLATHGEVSVVFCGLEFPTALHLNVDTDGWWRQTGDCVTFTDRGGQLTRGELFWPRMTCDEVIAKEYPFALNRPPCIAHLRPDSDSPTEHGLAESWRDGISNGCYDSTALRRARNWIFALHGRPFKSPDLRRFFGAFGWYRADADYSYERIRPAERRAVRFIQGLEERRQDCGEAP